MPHESLRQTMKVSGGIWVPDTFDIFPEGHPEAPRFTKHVEVADGNIIFLRLAGRGVKGDEVRDDHVERLLVGNGWETFDGGKTISHPTDTAFPGFMGFGRWIGWALTQEELLDAVAGRGVQSATEARFWAGLSLELASVSETYTLKKDSKKGKAGDTVTSTYTLPVKYLGAGAVEAEVVASAAAPAPAFSREEILALARTHTAHGPFLVEALSKFPDLRAQANAALFAEVANPDGIFREAH